MAQQQNAIHKFVLGTKELEGKNAEFQYDHGWYSITDIIGEERNEFYRSRNAQEAYVKWNVYIGRKKERPVKEDRHREDGVEREEIRRDRGGSRSEESGREERRRENRRKDESRSPERSADMVQDTGKNPDNAAQRRNERSRNRNRGERPQRQEQGGRMEGSDNGERTERSNRSDSTKRQGRPERPSRAERNDRGDKPERTGRTNRPERPNRPQTDRTAEPQGGEGPKMRISSSEGWDARKKDENKPRKERFRRNRQRKTEKDGE